MVVVVVVVGGWVGWVGIPPGLTPSKMPYVGAGLAPSEGGRKPRHVQGKTWGWGEACLARRWVVAFEPGPTPLEAMLKGGIFSSCIDTRHGNANARDSYQQK